VSLASRFLLLVLALVPAPAFAQAASCGGPDKGHRVFVNVNRVRVSSGLIAVSIYADNARKFLATRGALYVVRVPAIAGTTRVCVNLPGPGIYGLAVYHDMDSDRGFDRNRVGLPAEGYGFTNNPRLLFGIPAFSSVRINLPRTNMWTNVRMTYP